MSENSLDSQTLGTILEALVTEPAAVKIERQVDEQGVLLQVLVDPKDMGIVIGRNGMMATSIKTIMKAVGKANNMNVRIQFLEPDGSLRYGGRNNTQPESAPMPHSTDPEASKSLDEDLDEFVIN